jgi:aspartate 1-decarboxylase
MRVHLLKSKIHRARLRIMSFGLADLAEARRWQPRVILLDQHNALATQPARFAKPAST